MSPLLMMTAFLQIADENVRRRLIALTIALAAKKGGARKVLRSRVGLGKRNAMGPIEE